MAQTPKPRRRRPLVRALAAIAALGVLVAAGLAWLASSETAFAWALARVEAASAGRLKIAGARGTLLGPIAIERIQYADADIQVRAEDVRLAWSPWALLGDRLAVDSLAAQRVSLRLLPSETQGAFPTSIALPLRVDVERLSVASLEVERGPDRVSLRDLALGYEGGLGGHRIRSLRVASEWGTLEAKAELGARDPFALAADATFRQSPERAARIALSGTLKRVAARIDGEYDRIRAEIGAELAPFAALWLRELEGRATGIDLARLVMDAPASDIAVTVRAGSQDANRIGGSVEAVNASAGPLDAGRLPVARASAAFVTDFRTAQIDSVEIGLSGGGRLTGTGKVAADRAAVALDARAIDLRGIAADLLATALDGRIDAVFDQSGETVQAKLAQGPLAISLDAARRGRTIAVREARISARGGRVAAKGRLDLDGEMPVAATAAFTGFDPAEWGRYPPAKVNGTLALEGSLARRAGELSFDLRESRFRDAPASGRGTARLGAERVAGIEARLDVGANRIAARGAFGAPGDALVLTLTAPRLGQLDPRLDGRLDIATTVDGTWQAPKMRFTASAANVRVGDALAADAFGASGTLGWAPGAPLALEAEGSGIAVRGLAADRVGLRANGTLAQHAIEVTASGKSADLAARLAGGWRAGRGWSGTLAALENRGTLPMSLEAPMSLAIAPGRLDAGAASLRVGGGRVALGETHVAPGRVTTSGRFDAMPAAMLIALSRGAELVESTLLLEGSWGLAATPRLNGSIRIRRESGDLVFRTEPAFALGLSALELDAQILDERATGRLVAQGREIMLDARGEALPVGAGAEAGLAGDSPISLAARLDVPALAPIAALLRTRANFDGRVRADLTASGTIVRPVWQGRVEASEVRIASPPLGIDWHDGLLRAEITADAIRVSELSIAGGSGRLSGSGAVTQAGGDRSGQLSWRADRFAALNRPDRNLTLSGAGTIVADGRQLMLRGALRADSGHFEFEPQDTLELGDDVVVAGRKPRREAGAEGERRLPVLLAFDLDLGENLTIRGAGLDARLVGRLDVRSLPTGQVLGEGTIQTRRGSFRAYGQRLDIERGRLIFDGPIENPALDIAAWRRNQAVEAGVEVKGTLRAPFIRVVSNPPVSESEQLAWLVLGRPAETGAQTDYAALQVAAAALLGAVGGPNQQSFANLVGLDEIGVASDRSGSQAVTLGKRLSDRIYVSYEQSISAALAVLRLELALTRRFSVRAETGSQSGMDLFYRYSFD